MEIAECKTKNIKVFCLGVGSGANEQMILSMTTDGFGFHISSYRMLSEIMKNLSSERTAKAYQYLQLRIKPCEQSFSAGKPITFNIEVKNSHQKNPINGPIILEFEENDYFFLSELEIGTIQPNTTDHYELQLDPKPGVHPDFFPRELIFSYTVENIRRKGSVTLATGFLRGDFETSEPRNILLFGWKGMGKTAFLNNIITCLSMKPNRSTSLIVGDSEDHVTKHYQKVWIGKYIEREENEEMKQNISNGKEIKIHFFGPWGDSDMDYNTYTILRLTKGEIPPGTHKDSVQICAPDPANEIHAVVFLITLTYVEDVKRIKKMVDTMNMIKDAGYQPFLVVTRIDDISDLTIRGEMMDKLCEVVPLARNDICFQQNYHDQQYRDINIDLNTRRILSKILERSSNRINRFNDTYLRSIPWRCETILDPNSSTETEVVYQGNKIKIQDNQGFNNQFQGFNNQFQGFNNQNQGFNNQNQNQGFNNQNQNQGFNNQNQNQGFNNQNQNQFQGFNTERGFNNQNQNQGFNTERGFNNHDNQLNRSFSQGTSFKNIQINQSPGKKLQGSQYQGFNNNQNQEFNDNQSPGFNNQFQGFNTDRGFNNQNQKQGTDFNISGTKYQPTTWETNTRIVSRVTLSDMQNRKAEIDLTKYPKVTTFQDLYMISPVSQDISNNGVPIYSFYFNSLKIPFNSNINEFFSSETSVLISSG